jgi:hypothetical protein
MPELPGAIARAKNFVTEVKRALKIAKRLDGIELKHTAVEALRILENGHGHHRVACLDANGTPLPWYTYPAIEYIRQLDFSDKSIFEFGAGNSSLFWSGLARNIVSVEDNRAWFEKVSSQTTANLEVRFAEGVEAYVGEIHRDERNYDVIIVDGSHRARCAEVAFARLAPGGLIILDNSDCYPKTSAFLRRQELLEVDMTGFGPINGYAWTTSFFFHRDFRFRPLGGIQPKHGIGALQQYGEE